MVEFVTFKQRIERRNAMLNEHEIRERIHLANLELSGIMGTVGIVISDMNRRQYEDTRRNCAALKKRIDDLLDLIAELKD